MTVNVFISHASEDKDDLVRLLAHKLRNRYRLEVFYDEFSLRLGDSLREKIDEGLAKADYGLVVLSPNFFQKRWPQRELDGLVAREDASGNNMILPIWHKVDHATVAQFSPLLAGKKAAVTSSGIDDVVHQLAQRVGATAADDEKYRTTYRNQRVNLVEISRPHGIIEDSYFFHCTLVGPAVLRLSRGMVLDSIAIDGSKQVWLIQPNHSYEGAIILRNSKLEACEFSKVGLAVTPEELQHMANTMGHLHI